MKKFISLLILVFVTSSAFSQIAFQKGDKQINFGLNLGQGAGLYVSYENGLTHYISAGAEFGTGFSTTSVTYLQGNFRFSVFGNYHFAQLIGIPDEWDLYGGVDIGYSLWTKSNYPYNITQVYNEYANSFMIGIHGGGRWFWDEVWGVHAEIGGGYGYFVVKTGLSYKIN